MREQEDTQSTFCPADSLANLSAWQEGREGKKITAISGRKCFGLSRNLVRLGSLVRTYLGSLRLRENKFVRTWSVRDTLSPFLIMKLRLSERRTDESEFSLWQKNGCNGTLSIGELWGTPNTLDSMNSRSYDAMIRHIESFGGKGKRRPGNLREQVDPITNLACVNYMENKKLWPTPIANDAIKRGNVSPVKSNGLAGAARMWLTPSGSDGKRATEYKPESLAKCGADKNIAQQMANETRKGRLNPEWVEQLMGFPRGWTDISI